ncbi:31715_t:CDS:2, partial [Gigaspora margarita]
DCGPPNNCGASNDSPVIGNFALASSYLQQADSQVSLPNALVDLEVSDLNQRNGLSCNMLAKLDQNIS